MNDRAEAAAPPRRRGRTEAAQALREAKQALSRDHILAVAETVFADLGFAGTRMQDIAREAGISLATLYQFYPGKQDLHRAVLLGRDREMLDAVMQDIRPPVPGAHPLVPLLRMLARNLTYLLGHPDYLRMILQEGHVWYHVAAQPTAAEQQMWETGERLIGDVFEAGVRDGLLIPGDKRDQARLLLALQQTRLANWVAGGMAEAGEAVIARFQCDFVRLFCRPAVARALLAEEGAALRPEIRSAVEA